MRANTVQELEQAISDKEATREGLDTQLAQVKKDIAELTEALSKTKETKETKPK